MRLSGWLSGLVVGVLMSGCSMPERLLKPDPVSGPASIAPYDLRTHTQSVHTFDAIDLKPLVAREQWQPRVDHLIVVWDQAGLSRASKESPRPLAVDGREWLRRFNRTLPVAQLPGALLVTSGGNTPKPADFAGASYEPMALEQALDKGAAGWRVGGDDLAQTVARATELAVALPGRSSLVVISAWERMTPSVLDAFSRYHQRLTHRSGLNVANSTRAWAGKPNVGGCVHVVGVGNLFSRERLLTVPDCTSAHTFDATAQPRDMAQFVGNLLYAGPADDDGDGIPNYLDACPATPEGRLVTSRGCLRFPSKEELADEQKAEKASSASAKMPEVANGGVK